MFFYESICELQVKQDVIGQQNPDNKRTTRRNQKATKDLGPCLQIPHIHEQISVYRDYFLPD